MDFQILFDLGNTFRCWKLITVNPFLSGHAKLDKTQILMTSGTLMKVESIAECSMWSILQTFDLH